MLVADCGVSKTPGILVQYKTDGIGIEGVAQMVWPDRTVIGDLPALKRYLDELRTSHDRLFHLARSSRQVSA